jgi:hypothetical protein
LSNTRHARRLVPIPPEPAGEVQDGPSLLSVIVAGFSQALERHHALPGCDPCVEHAKRAEVAHGIAVGNARAAAEPEPVFSLPDIQQAITQQDGRWVCFGHYELRDVPQP